jgi:predicted  nucleic acid-binding Zn-ribbon protein
MASSPLRPGADLKEQLDWYKTQYAQLETDLSEFQSSSKELEEQLEKDVEAAEKNERKWKEQVEKLQFEVEEWKTKHKQAKAEANSAQTALQKEITTMRETNRALQLKLRDIEVMNDDYERQARNTESSLEDLEGKYNSAIEQRVMLDEEIKIGEQERESLRIEAQRLRDELGDLKVESEITLEKLRLAGETISTLRARRPAQLAVDSLRARSPLSEASGMTPLSPTASTPPPRSDTASEMATPPSPPLSDAPAHVKSPQRTPALVRKRSMVPDSSTTPKPSSHTSRAPSRHVRGSSYASSAGTVPTTSDSRSMRPPPTRVRTGRPSHASPGSTSRTESLSQIRGLIGRMQKIEERVHYARSKLPTPSNTTPRGSPRAGYASGENVPSSVTVRRASKRTSASLSSSALQSEESAPEAPSRRTSHVKRLSFGIPRPTSVVGHRTDVPDRPPSALEGHSTTSHIARPASRQSLAGSTRPASRTGARTAEPGHYPMSDATTTTTTTSASSTTSGYPGRSRSSMGGNYTTTIPPSHRKHRPSASVSELRRKANESDDAFNSPSSAGAKNSLSHHHSSASTSSHILHKKASNAAIPPPQFALPRRQSGGLPRPLTKRSSSNFGASTGAFDGGSSLTNHQMLPPPSRKRMSDVGETY